MAREPEPVKERVRTAEDTVMAQASAVVEEAIAKQAAKAVEAFRSRLRKKHRR